MCIAFCTVQWTSHCKQVVFSINVCYIKADDLLWAQQKAVKENGLEITVRNLDYIRLIH